MCSACGVRRAKILQNHTGRKLCEQCFFNDIVERVRREIKRYGMIDQGDRILLAVSGGKDSFVMLDVLSQIYDPSKMGCATVVEGIEGYNRAEDLDRLRRYARDRGIDFHSIEIKDMAGLSVDEMVDLSKRKNIKIAPCTYCGIYRRRGMNEIAREYGYTKIATAHNLDDEAQTMIINILRGDITRLLQLYPLRIRPSKLFVPKIKPLRKIYEWENAKYSYYKGFIPQETECPHLWAMPTMRARIRFTLYNIEKLKPGILLELMEWFDSLMEKIYSEEKPKDIELPRCSICGEPTSANRSICKACELLLGLGIKVGAEVNQRQAIRIGK